jgi:hypothetical protein
MAPPRDALRYPAKRVLLQRTRLAYVHLQNLLTDAKRDRAAKVYGYVSVWLPEELLTLYLEEGEVVNATTTEDGVAFEPIAIRDATARVPHSAEYGSICFHEAQDEQMDLMFASQTGTPMAWPRELATTSADAILEFLYATMHDGAVEVQADGQVHYLIVVAGSPVRGYFADGPSGDVVAHFRARLAPGAHAAKPLVRLWARPDALPAQASPALIQAYRELIPAFAERAVALGAAGAPAAIEASRCRQVHQHPLLERFSPKVPVVRDPVADTAQLTRAIGAWLADALPAALPAGHAPEALVKEVTGARKHMFRAAGLYDALPWPTTW